jgi:hypothetical protein
MSGGMLIKKLPTSSKPKTEEEKIPEIAQEDKPLYQRVGDELMGSEGSWIARKKKALRDRISDWSIDNINMPLKDAGYPNVGATLGAIPETVADLVIPGSGMELLPMNKIGATLSKGAGRLGIRTVGKEFNDLRKAKMTEQAHNAIAKDTKGFRANTITSPEMKMQQDLAAAEAKLGRKFSPEEAQMAKNTLQKKYMPDVMADAGTKAAEQRAMAAGVELNKKPEVVKQVFKKNPMDNLTPREKAQVEAMDVGSLDERIALVLSGRSK